MSSYLRKQRVDKKEAVVRLDGVMHKIGAHGFVYKFINDAWIRSTRPVDEVLAALGKGCVR